LIGRAFAVALPAPQLSRPSLIDALVVFGVAVVLPLVFGGSAWRWRVAAVGAAVSFVLPRGPAASVCVMPFVVVTTFAAFSRVRDGGAVRLWTAEHVLGVLASAYAGVAAGSLVVSRLGWTPFGISEPIVELTAAHYTYAGAAGVTLVVAARRRAPSGWRRFSDMAALLVAAAPPVVALGFFTVAALPQVGGAVLLTGGVWATAVLQLREARRLSRGTSRFLLCVSSVAVVASMVLAVDWAAAEHWPLPALSIPDMARTHGIANAFGFVLCGLLARRHTTSTATAVPT
jgi:hypothetical protein